MIHFRRVLIDSKEEAGSPCFPPHSLVAAFAVQGYREEGNEEIAVGAKARGNQSLLVSLLCLWSLSLTLCVPVLVGFLVFVFPRGSPARTDLCKENPSTFCQKEFLPC